MKPNVKVKKKIKKKTNIHLEKRIRYVVFNIKWSDMSTSYEQILLKIETRVNQRPM